MARVLTTQQNKKNTFIYSAGMIEYHPCKDMLLNLMCNFIVPDFVATLSLCYSTGTTFSFKRTDYYKLNTKIMVIIVLSTMSCSH